jgi:hypothetical protein
VLTHLAQTPVNLFGGNLFYEEEIGFIRVIFPIKEVLLLSKSLDVIVRNIQAF